MSATENLRAFFSTEGVSQKRTQNDLQATLVRALEQTPPGKQEAEKIARQQATDSVNQAGNRQNVFVTSASLATFPVASGVITVVWRLFQFIAPNVAAMKSPIIPLVLAILLGGFLLFMDTTDPERTIPLKPRDKVVKIVIALINSLFLTAAVLGIDTAVLQPALVP